MFSQKYPPSHFALMASLIFLIGFLAPAWGIA